MRVGELAAAVGETDGADALPFASLWSRAGRPRRAAPRARIA
jgi:hypothetical protein